MRSNSKKKGAAVLKVNVPTFKVEKANEFSDMIEQAFENGDKPFEWDGKKGTKKLGKYETGGPVKLPALGKDLDASGKLGSSSRVKNGE